MKIDEISEVVTEKLSKDMDTWNDVLNNTVPGNYGCNDWSAEIDYDKVWVDVPKRTFKVKKRVFNASLVLWDSKEIIHLMKALSRFFSVSKSFNFKNSNNIAISNIDLKIDKNIYDD